MAKVEMLIMEDDAQCAETMWTPGEHGVDAVVARSIDEFGRLIRERTWSIISLDMDMGMDGGGPIAGLEAVDMLRDASVPPNIVLVFHSSSESGRRRQQFRAVVLGYVRTHSIDRLDWAEEIAPILTHEQITVDLQERMGGVA